MADWQERAAAKRAGIDALIPAKWRLSALPTAEEQKDVTGAYIQQYLSAREIEITEEDAVGIYEHTSTGQWKCREVTEAFCHRAALAHQLVGREQGERLVGMRAADTAGRRTACTRSSSRRRCRRRTVWTTDGQKAGRWGRCTGCR